MTRWSPTAESPPLFYRAEDGFHKPIFEVHDIRRLAQVHAGGAYGAAVLLLQACFGHAWVVRQVLDSRSFLGCIEDGRGKLESWQVVYRVINLAEMIFNLLPKGSVSAPLTQLAGGDIESGYAELEAAKLLFTFGIPFEFRLPSGTPGDSYDIDLWLQDGTHVCADTKCKLEGAVFSAASLMTSLRRARRENLPKDRPGAVFVKVPQAWYETDMINIESTCNEFLRRTKRIVNVNIFSSLERHDEDTGITHDVIVGKEIRNNFSDYGDQDKLRLFTAGPDQGRLFGWQRFADLLVDEAE